MSQVKNMTSCKYTILSQIYVNQLINVDVLAIQHSVKIGENCQSKIDLSNWGMAEGEQDDG